MARDTKSNPEQSWISREDLQDIAKIGGDLLKRTVTSSIDVIKDVTDTLPKDASQIITKSREEMMKGLSREFAQNLVSLAVEKMFAAVRDHRLDISIRVRKANEQPQQEAPAPRSNENAHSEQSAQRSNSEARAHPRSGSDNHPGSRRNHPHRHRP